MAIVHAPLCEGKTIMPIAQDLSTTTKHEPIPAVPSNDNVPKWLVQIEGGVPLRAANDNIPAHVRRANNNMCMSLGYFSVLEELLRLLFWPLHEMGYDIPPRLKVDGPVGRLFCVLLRDHGVVPEAFPTYFYQLDNGLHIRARRYPDKYLAGFRKWFQGTWLPGPGWNYFERYDPVALPYIARLLTRLGLRRA